MIENRDSGEFDLMPDYDLSDDSPVIKEEYETLEDGFNITRGTKGYIDLEYWGNLTGYTAEQLISMENGLLIWKDPEQVRIGADAYVGWVTREQLLQGNRREKLDLARELLDEEPLLEAAVELLKKNLPEAVNFADIYFTMGTPWVRSIEGLVESFLAQLLEMSVPPKVVKNLSTGKPEIIYEKLCGPNTNLNRSVYGTDCMTAIETAENILKGELVTIYDRVPVEGSFKLKSVPNQEKTHLQRERVHRINKAFREYCTESEARKSLIAMAYTDSFKYSISEYDGSYLKMEDLAPGIELYPYQKDAIAHAIDKRNVYFAHKVGAGKTFEICSSVHELLRMKFGSKALVVVPSDRVADAVSAYHQLFPNDRYMVVRNKAEFVKAKRSETLEMMKNTEASIVFMADDSFNMISVTKEYAFGKKDRQIRECKRQLAMASDYQTRKRLEELLKKLEKAAEKYKKEFVDGETACFNELGFDILVVDEAHNYKNLTLGGASGSVVGMHSKGSAKADKLLEKVRYIQEIRGRVIFASGTPTPNSLADLYVMQLYLQPEELKLRKMENFNDWLMTFGEEDLNYWVGIDGQSGGLRSRYSSFHNLPELMAMISDFCDFHMEDLPDINLPVFEGYTDVVVKRTELQKTLFEWIRERIEAIHNREVTSDQDNMLKVTIDGRLITLHPALLPKRDWGQNKELAELMKKAKCEPGKIGACAEHAAANYFDVPDTCQLIFCDIGTPKKGFNVYDELKRELISRGIPEDQIAYIHDATTEAERVSLEKRFNAGKIRILIGSTQKAGTGLNIQNKLYAVHHLDVPWRPADMVQRDGRILRQGNTCSHVKIYRYITEASFDAYLYQLLESKQRFNAQFLSGSLAADHRDEKDFSDTVLSYAEGKALAIGDPKIRERVELTNKIERAQIGHKARRKELQKYAELEEMLPGSIERRKALIITAQADAAYYQAHKETVDREERRDFGEELLICLSTNILETKEQVFDTYQGFHVILPANMKHENKHVILTREGGIRHLIRMDTNKTMGCCQRLDFCLEHLEDEVQRHKDKLKELEEQLEQAKKELLLGNSYEEELMSLADELRILDEELNKEAAA